MLSIKRLCYNLFALLFSAFSLLSAFAFAQYFYPCVDMMEHIDLLYVITMIGTFSFAISGALLGFKKKMDAYGMFILAFVTTAGGGTMRDIMLGRFPPFILTDGMYVLVSIFATFVVLFMPKTVERNVFLINVSDAIGLGVFTCIGASVGLSAGVDWYGIVLLGTITATVGGMIRDILAREVPFVLQKEIYASASVLGGFIFIGLNHIDIGLNLNILISSAATTAFRLFCMHYDMQFPQTLRG